MTVPIFISVGRNPSEQRAQDLFDRFSMLAFNFNLLKGAEFMSKLTAEMSRTESILQMIESGNLKLQFERIEREESEAARQEAMQRANKQYAFFLSQFLPEDLREFIAMDSIRYMHAYPADLSNFTGDAFRLDLPVAGLMGVSINKKFEVLYWVPVIVPHEGKKPQLCTWLHDPLIETCDQNPETYTDHEMAIARTYQRLKEFEGLTSPFAVG